MAARKSLSFRAKPIAGLLALTLLHGLANQAGLNGATHAATLASPPAEALPDWSGIELLWQPLPAELAPGSGLTQLRLKRPRLPRPSETDFSDWPVTDEWENQTYHGWLYPASTLQGWSIPLTDSGPSLFDPAFPSLLGLPAISVPDFYHWGGSRTVLRLAASGTDWADTGTPVSTVWNIPAFAPAGRYQDGPGTFTAPAPSLSHLSTLGPVSDSAVVPQPAGLGVTQSDAAGSMLGGKLTGPEIALPLKSDSIYNPYVLYWGTIDVSDHVYLGAFDPGIMARATNGLIVNGAISIDTEYYNTFYTPGRMGAAVEVTGDLVNNGTIDTAFDYYEYFKAVRGVDDEWMSRHMRFDMGHPYSVGAFFDVAGSVSGSGTWSTNNGAIMVQSTGPISISGSLSATRGNAITFSSDSDVSAPAFQGGGALRLFARGTATYNGGPGNVYLSGNTVRYGGGLVITDGSYMFIEAKHFSFSGPIFADGSSVDVEIIDSGSVSSVGAANGGSVSVAMSVPLNLDSSSPITSTGSVDAWGGPSGSWVTLYTSSAHLTGKSLIVSGGSNTSGNGIRYSHINLSSADLVLDGSQPNGQPGDISNGADAGSAGVINFSGNAPWGQASRLTVANTNFITPPAHADGSQVTFSVSKFTQINFTNVTVDGGTLVPLTPLYDAGGTYTTVTGDLSFRNHATGTLHDLTLGDHLPDPLAAQPPATVIDIDPTSSLTLRNVDLFNMNWTNHLNGTLTIDGTVRDGGFFTGMDVSGTGTLNVLAGATLTTVNQTDNTNALMYHGHPGVTLTGQGIVDRAYPVNRGTILSPDTGALTIQALPAGQSWSPVADPTTPPINGTSQTFYNYAGAVIRYQGDGGILLNGFTDGIDNQGLIEALSGTALAASAATGLGGHVFSSQQDAQGKIIRGTIRANGASVNWGPNPATDSNALIESQIIQVVNGASVIFDYYNFKNDLIDASPLASGGSAGSILSGGTGPVLGTIGTASQDVAALTTFSNVTLTGAATVLQLSGSQSIALDTGRAEPGLHITNGAQLQLVGNGAHTVYGTVLLPYVPASTAPSLGFAIGRIAVDTGGSLLGAGNTTPNQFGLTLGSGGTLTVYNPNLTHDVATINLADAPVLIPASPFRFSAVRAPGTGAAATLSAASLPGATSAQTLTVLGDLQMAAGSTLAVSIFGDATNANSLLMAGSSSTAASSLAGTLSVTVTPGVASLSATTLFVVFQENGAGYGSSRFGNAPATGSTITSADGNWIFGVNYVGNQVILSNATAVPEPATCATLAGLAALGLVCWRRRGREHDA